MKHKITGLLSGLLFVIFSVIALPVKMSSQQQCARGAVVKTTDYVTLSNDSGKILAMDCASACTVTLPNPPPTAMWTIWVQALGAGTVSVYPNGLNINLSPSSVLLSGVGTITQISTDGSNYYAGTVASGNASSLGGHTFANPGPIGSTTPSTGAFTTLSASGHVTLNGLLSSGTVATALCGDSSGNIIAMSSGNCFSGAVTISTNGVSNAIQTTLNFVTSSTNAVGLTVTPGYSSGGVETFEITGSYSGSLGSATGLPLASITGLGSGVSSFLATASSANLLAALTTSTGTGLAVFNANPTIAGATLTGALTGTGNYLPVTLFNFGTGASASTVWCGNGTWCTPTASGSVTSFSAGNLLPLFTTSVANATSTPALTFVLSNAPQNSVLAGPPTGGAGVPTYQLAPTISAANMTNFPTLNQTTTGTAAGLTGCSVATLGSICYWTGSAWSAFAGGTGVLTESSGTPSWSTSSGTGTVTVVSSGTLTSTALVTGGGSQTLQTPSATSTLSSAGNLSVPGTITAGAGFISGTLPSGITSGAAGGTGWTEASSTGWTLTASVDYIRADTSHNLLMGLGNAGSEFIIVALAGDICGTQIAPTVCGLTTPSLHAGASPITETWVVGTGGVTANTLVQTDTSAPSKIIATTTGAYGIAQTTQSAAANVEVARYGTATCIIDNNAVAGDLVIIGTSNATFCKDSGQTASSGIAVSSRIVGVFRTSATAGGGATALVELTPAHFGTSGAVMTWPSGSQAGFAIYSGANTWGTTLADPLAVGHGGTGQSSAAAGTLLYATSSSAASFSATPTLGVQGTTAGSLTIAGASSTSGSITLNGFTSGSTTLSATATGGTLNLGSTNATITAAGALTVASCTGCAVGGTGLSGMSQYGIPVAATATTVTASITPSSTSGVPLISQGSAANPIFGTAVVAGGGTGATTAAGALVNLLPAGTQIGDLLYCSAYSTGACTTWSLLAGNNSGTKVLQENASGTPSWGTAGGGGGGPTYVDITADQTINATGLQNVTGLSFPVSASTNYSAVCRVVAEATGSTTTAFTFTGPASPTFLYFAMSANQTNFTTFGTTGTLTTSTSANKTTEIWFQLINGSNAGTIQLQAQNSTTGGSVIIRAGSYCQYTTMP